MPNFGAVALMMFGLAKRKSANKRIDWDAYEEWHFQKAHRESFFDREKPVIFGERQEYDGEPGVHISQDGYHGWIPDRFIIED